MKTYSGPTARLAAPRYVLGEEELSHEDIPGFEERARDLKMALQPRLWGWGTVRRTRCDVAELAIESGRQALRAADAEPAAVDALLVCSTRFPGGAPEHAALAQTIMSGLGLRDAAFSGLALNRCAGLVAAIDLAVALVNAGRYQTILVITADRVANETERVENFALFSDGSASCLVTGGQAAGPSFEVISCASRHQNTDLSWSAEISPELTRLVNDSLLKPVGVPLGHIDRLFHANLVQPLIAMKELQAGFTAGQLYTDNIARFGHCFAADPLINLADFAASGMVREGALYMLAVSLPGSRTGVLLRANS